MLRPLQNRVLVRPDAPQTETDSGLVLLQDSSQPEMSGEVVSVGHGPAAAQRVRQKAIARCMAIVDEVAEQVPLAALQTAIHAALHAYLMEIGDHSEVRPGDQVCFSYTAGQKVTIEGESLILLNEDELAAVWTPDEAAA